MRARVQWARRQGHPDYLWPDVAIVRWRTALRGVEEAVRAGLASRGDAAHASIAPHLLEEDPAGVTALGIAAFTSGTGPLLGRWIEEGRLEASAAVAALLADHLRHGRVRAKRMADLLREAVAALCHGGLRPVVLKGLHTGAAYFPEPGSRPAADIDLAVRPGEIEAAERALAGLGWTRTARRTAPYRSEWTPREPQAIRSLELTHAGNPVAIDLHGGLDRDFFGVRRLRFGDAPFDTAVPLPGVPGALALSQPHLLIFLAAHASEEFHRLQLLRLAELVLVAARDVTTAETRAAVREWTGRLDAGRFLLPSVQLADRLAPGVIDPDWLADLEADASPRMRRTLVDMRPSDAQRLEGLALRDRFLFARGAAEWLGRAAFLVWPARSRGVRAVYAERIWRLLRGRVSLGSAGPPADG